MTMVQQGDILDLRGRTPLEDHPDNPKMPAIHAHWQDGYTSLPNLAEVAWSLRRAPAEITEFLAIELGQQETKEGKIPGQHTDETLQDLIYLYIDKFVLCPNCQQPETEYKCVHKTQNIWHDCSSCGLKKKVIDRHHPLCEYILRTDKHKKDAAKKHKKDAKKNSKKKPKLTLGEMLERDHQNSHIKHYDSDNADEDHDDDIASLATDAAVGTPLAQDLLVRPKPSIHQQLFTPPPSKKKTPSTNSPRTSPPRGTPPPTPILEQEGKNDPDDEIPPPTAPTPTPTKTAETMTKEDFQAFQRDKMDQTTEHFMAQIRNAILTQNNNGGFLHHRISPSVLTDDWVLSATTFVQKLSNDNINKNNEPPIIQLEFTCKVAAYKEGWLKLMIRDHDYPLGHPLAWYALPLVMFSPRNDEQLQTVLEHIRTAVEQVCRDQFPHCTILKSETAQTFLTSMPSAKTIGKTPAPAAAAASLPNKVAGDDWGVGDVLTKVQELQARGATKTDIKAELKRAKAERKGWKTNPTDNDDHNKESQDEQEDEEEKGDESKYRKRSLWESILVFRQAPRYWDSPGKGNGGTWWVWKGLLASVALYYIYAWMR